MTTDDVKRKLSAILSADVQGYSRLMGDDERATVDTITAYRTIHAYPVDAEGRFGGMVLWAADIPDDPVRYKNSSLMRQLAPNISRVSNG